MKESFAIFYIALIVVLYIGVLILVPMIIDESVKRRRRKTVGELITSAHDKSPLTRKQIEILAANYSLTSRDTQILLRNQFSEAIKANDENRDSRIKYFQSLYEVIEKDEPFEGLPSDVRLHLERIRESIGEDKDYLMQPLASQLQDLNSTNRRKEKLMWGLTIASFAVGVVGVIFGAIPYLSSQPQKSIMPEASVVAPTDASSVAGFASQSSGSVKESH